MSKSGRKAQRNGVVIRRSGWLERRQCARMDSQTHINQRNSPKHATADCSTKRVEGKVRERMPATSCQTEQHATLRSMPSMRPNGCATKSKSTAVVSNSCKPIRRCEVEAFKTWLRPKRRTNEQRPDATCGYTCLGASHSAIEAGPGRGWESRSRHPPC